MKQYYKLNDITRDILLEPHYIFMKKIDFLKPWEVEMLTDTIDIYINDVENDLNKKNIGSKSYIKLEDRLQRLKNNRMSLINKYKLLRKSDAIYRAENKGTIWDDFAPDTSEDLDDMNLLDDFISDAHTGRSAMKKQPSFNKMHVNPSIIKNKIIKPPQINIDKIKSHITPKMSAIRTIQNPRLDKIHLITKSQTTRITKNLKGVNKKTTK